MIVNTQNFSVIDDLVRHCQVLECQSPQSDTALTLDWIGDVDFGLIQNLIA